MTCRFERLGDWIPILQSCSGRRKSVHTSGWRTCLVTRKVSRPMAVISALIRLRLNCHMTASFDKLGADDDILLFRNWVFGRTFVKRFALCYRTVVLSVCLSVCTLVYCGQTVGWIKMKLGMEVGLVPCNFRPTSIVHKRLDGSRCHLARR